MSEAVTPLPGGGGSGQPEPRRLQLQVRRAAPDDAGALAAVFVDAWRAGYPGVVGGEVLEALDVGRTECWLGAQIGSAGSVTLVGVSASGELVGFTRFGDDPDDPSRGHVFSLYVAPPVSGRGIGKALLGHSVQGLGGARRAVSLWVFEANQRARSLYSSAGFVADGDRRTEDAYGAGEVRLVRPASPWRVGGHS